MKKMTLPEVVINAAEQFGDAIAIQEAHQQFTFNELNALRIQSCQAFMAAGVEKGDRVAIWAPNIAEWVIAAIGLQSAGGVLVPINTRINGSEAALIINNSGVKLLFTVASFLDIDCPEMLADQEMPALEAMIFLREPDKQTVYNGSEVFMSWRSFLSMAEQVPPSDAEQRAASVMPDDTMDIMFTSGTTGKPKGVVCAHGQNIESFITWGKLRGFSSSDNCLIISPFFYSYGYKAGWLACLIHGATMSPVLSFDLDKVLEQIERDRISVLSGTPSMYQSILAHPKKTVYDLSSLRLAGTGGAPVPVFLIEKIRRELGFECVTTGYGLTETCGIVTLTHADDTPEIVSTTSGRAMPGVEIKCIAMDGTPVPVGEAGEICVRGYNLMQGYFNNPAATAEAIDADGWLHTGDIGILDEQGYLKITDRLKDMIISGGFNVYPAEIENGLANIEGVVQSAVIGIADERMGEVPKAFIVKSQGSELTAQQVTDWCRANMANYKVPRAVEFIDAMPLNASGKIVKGELRQRI